MGRPHMTPPLPKYGANQRSLIAEERNHLSLSLANTLLRKEVFKECRFTQKTLRETTLAGL